MDEEEDVEDTGNPEEKLLDVLDVMVVESLVIPDEEDILDMIVEGKIWKNYLHDYYDHLLRLTG